MSATEAGNDLKVYVLRESDFPAPITCGICDRSLREGDLYVLAKNNSLAVRVIRKLFGVKQRMNPFDEYVVGICCSGVKD